MAYLIVGSIKLSESGVTAQNCKKWTLKVLDPYSLDNTDQIFPNRIPVKLSDLGKKKSRNPIEADASSIWNALPKPHPLSTF